MGEAVEKFIERWKPSGGSEQGNSQSFLNELCALLKVDAPQPTRPDDPALAAQAQAARQALEALAAPADVATVSKCFSRAPRARVAELLETLAGLGQARVLGAGRYAGR